MMFQVQRTNNGDFAGEVEDMHRLGCPRLLCDVGVLVVLCSCVMDLLNKNRVIYSCANSDCELSRRAEALLNLTMVHESC